MAEAQNEVEEPSLASGGKVQAVRKQWAVHEDGALAYQIQNDEINQHYGLNRFHRRRVREDIPVAKFVQSEEELQQQEERMRELEVLKAQAEEDAKVAKKISRQMRQEVRHHGEYEAVDDEELARQLQEKEKKKYERHLEKKRERKLKKERELLEAALAKDLEEARLTQNSENSSDPVSASLESLNLQGVSVTRVTPSGQIEDDGDFSDFYNLPPEMDEFTRLEIQASQDEELATLLQEQEHKRTKAQVDQEKLRRIEIQDEQLARIMQEQEKLRLKKAKQKHRARKEARRQLSTESMPLGASANTMTQQMQELPQNIVHTAVPANSSVHHRYRSNSYTQAFDSPPSPPHSPPPHRLTSERANTGQGQQRVLPKESTTASANYNYKSQIPSQTRQTATQSSSSSTSSPLLVYAGSTRGMSTLESARQIAAGNPEGILAVQNSHKAVDGNRGRLLQENTIISHHSSNMDAIHGYSHQERSSGPGRERANPHRPGEHPQTDPVLYSQPFKPHGVPLGTELRHSDVDEVQNLMTSRDGRNSSSAAKIPLHQETQQQPPAKPGFYSREEDDPHLDSYPSGLAGFNIAAAIDPTYQRRHPEASFPQETQLTSHIPFSRSLPQNDGELQWDPNLRGSLRRTRAQVYGYQDSDGEGSYVQEDIVEPASSWQPVQGQRRKDLSSRNKSRNDAKGNCKQQ